MFQKCSKMFKNVQKCSKTLLVKTSRLQFNVLPRTTICAGRSPTFLSSFVSTRETPTPFSRLQELYAYSTREPVASFASFSYSALAFEQLFSSPCDSGASPRGSCLVSKSPWTFSGVLGLIKVWGWLFYSHLVYNMDFGIPFPYHKKTHTFRLKSGSLALA